MAIVVMLFPTRDSGPMLRPGVLEELARLGVTNVALLRDRSLAGLVLEGWSFVAESVPHAATLVAGDADDVRTLHPLAQMAVSPAPNGGAIR